MLQLPESNARVAPRSPRNYDRPKKPALSLIKASIQPIGEDPNLHNELCYMAEQNNIAGMVALYDAYSSAARGFLLIQNQPCTPEMADDFLELERCQMWSKAYLVADFLKNLRPDKFQAEAYARTLFDCAFQMGLNLAEAAAIVHEITEMRPGDKPVQNQPVKTAPQKISRLSSLITSFEALLRRYFELDDAGDGSGAEFDAIGDRIGDLIHEGSFLTAETETEAAFLIMLANSTVDLTINGTTDLTKRDAAKRLERLLRGVMAFIPAGVKDIPHSSKFMWLSEPARP